MNPKTKEAVEWAEACAYFNVEQLKVIAENLKALRMATWQKTKLKDVKDVKLVANCYYLVKVTDHASWNSISRWTARGWDTILGSFPAGHGATRKVEVLV
jgi:hypothetical protein